VEALIEVGGGTLLKKLPKKVEDVREVIFLVKIQYGKDDLNVLKKIEGAERIYTVELVMDSCLNQNVKWN
jgi:hypothetical protein